MARVLVISSHVARGCVGLAATVPALQWLGHDVWALPTIVLASRPGLGHFVRHDLPPPGLDAMLSALEADGCWPSLDGVIAGYFPSRRSVQVAGRAVARIKAANPRALVLVDPIVGDAGKLYVAEDIAAAIRDELLPLASVATPNLFELQWLSGTSVTARDDIAHAARELGPPTTIVTSALQTPDSIATLLVAAGAVVETAAPARAGIPNGAGDLFAGLLLGHLLNGQTAEAALVATLKTLDRVLAASEDRQVLQLSALTAQAT